MHSWPFRAAVCAQAITALDADLVALQEVFGFQLASLLRRLPGHAATGAPRGDGRRRGERCTVLYRTARLQLFHSETRWYSDPPFTPGSRGWGNPVPRIATLCRFRDTLTRREFGAVSTHWDGASAASRQRSAEALLSWLDPALPWIVAGDLNATAGTPAVARLRDGGLRDTLPELGDGGRMPPRTIPGTGRPTARASISCWSRASGVSTPPRYGTTVPAAASHRITGQLSRTCAWRANPSSRPCEALRGPRGKRADGAPAHREKVPRDHVWRFAAHSASSRHTKRSFCRSCMASISSSRVFMTKGP